MIGRTLGNRYQIIEKIGSGGMSHVYKAKCTLLNRYVAVKTLRPEFTSDDEFVRKFRREAQAAASLSHQNIVSIYDVGTDGDTYYIVMEYVEGKTLKQMIKEQKRLTPAQTAEIAVQVCKALGHAHRNHIIHRDIKPHNILITSSDHTVKVTDFGIARAATGATVTSSGNVIGTVHYFSPEQARGGYIDEKSDLYSLGIVMYEMVTGHVPFEGESPISIALKHLQEPLVSPGKLVDQLPRGLEEIIIKATRKEASKRYISSDEMLKDLKLFIADNKVVFGYNEGHEDEQDKPTIVIPAVKSDPDKHDAYRRAGERKGDTHKNNRSKKRVFTGIAIALLVAALAFGSFYIVKELLYVKAVEVPRLIGEDEQKAEEILKDSGLEMKVDKRQYNVNFEEGTVISQYPKAGTKNKVKNPVLVVVSLGPQKTTVPDLINNNSYEADLKLENAGLDVGEVETVYSDEVAIGYIIDQNPKPGIEVNEGTTVDIVISTGVEPEQVRVPEVTGLDLKTAQDKIEKEGLVLGDTRYQQSNLVPKGYVVTQSINAGSIVQEGTSMVLEVSSGPEVVDNTTPEQEERTEILTVELPEGETDIKVTVKKYQDGVEDIIYQMRHNGDEGPLKIPIEGKGKVRIVVLFNDVPKKDITIDFSREE